LRKKLKILSLFANTGVAESLLNETNAEVVIANEIDERRCKFYQSIYPKTKVICGDIRNNEIFSTIIEEAIKSKIDLIISTPPCQGMSTVGKQDKHDERNQLIYYALEVVKRVKPKYVLIENVPQQLKTSILVNNVFLLIPEYIKHSLKNEYYIKDSIINSADYGVPQIRKRSLFLLTRKEIKNTLDFLNNSEFSKHITLEESIGHLPSIDPKIQGFSEKEQLNYFPEFEIKKNRALLISSWHRPPLHKIRHVEVMLRTSEGCSALSNKVFYPKKPDGTKIKGYKNTYRRQLWNRPSYTVTTYNGAICSQDNVHPGREFYLNSEKVYSDPRVFSILELMIVMSIPTSWDIPRWANDSLIRHSIGEGLPPLVLKKIIDKLFLKNES
jgi:DNA (cytosine-5)-methyltransferase 1